MVNQMSLPDSLAMSLASSALDLDRQHSLTLFQRRTIYGEIERVGGDRAAKVRGLLGILTARRVLPIWYKAFPANDEPELLLEASEAVVSRGAEAPPLVSKAGELFDRVDMEFHHRIKQAPLVAVQLIRRHPASCDV